MRWEGSITPDHAAVLHDLWKNAIDVAEKLLRIAVLSHRYATDRNETTVQTNGRSLKLVTASYLNRLRTRKKQINISKRSKRTVFLIHNTSRKGADLPRLADRLRFGPIV
jgi:hypothetical protein